MTIRIIPKLRDKRFVAMVDKLSSFKAVLNISSERSSGSRGSRRVLSFSILFNMLTGSPDVSPVSCLGLK